MQVIVGRRAKLRISADPAGRKDELPPPFGRRLRELPLQCTLEDHAAKPGGQVCLMNRADSFKMPSQGIAERVWQHHAPIFLTLASTRRDFASVEIHILHAGSSERKPLRSAGCSAARESPRARDRAASVVRPSWSATTTVASSRSRKQGDHANQAHDTTEGRASLHPELGKSVCAVGPVTSGCAQSRPWRTTVPGPAWPSSCRRGMS